VTPLPIRKISRIGLSGELVVRVILPGAAPAIRAVKASFKGIGLPAVTSNGGVGLTREKSFVWGVGCAHAQRTAASVCQHHVAPHRHPDESISESTGSGVREPLGVAVRRDVMLTNTGSGPLRVSAADPQTKLFLW